MLVAIQEAQLAVAAGEIPIGAVVVGSDGSFLASGHNLTITNSDPTAHAEIIALREAASKIGNYRLPGTTVYTTIEPCAMCAGALVNARVARLVFGAHDERFGAVETHFGIGIGSELNHRITVNSGILAAECRTLMQSFFRVRRRGSAATE